MSKIKSVLSRIFLASDDFCYQDRCRVLYGSSIETQRTRAARKHAIQSTRKHAI